MTISYKWLSQYLPEPIAADRLGQILTAIGLEVESQEVYNSVEGGLEGLVVGEVLSAEPHPNADKLKITSVNIGTGDPLNIVCGAPNVAAGQKVIVAPIGTTLYPSDGKPLTMKAAKIRGVESAGMICAEDEIGTGASHDGILVLPQTARPGTPAAEQLEVYTDTIYEIGLTPNRMDAMSHWGVARDVTAYLSHHGAKKESVRLPEIAALPGFKGKNPLRITVEDPVACLRYSGLSIRNVKIGPAPRWMQDQLRAIGVKPINNLVDITNYILHETGQPLHAFDADQIQGGQIIVRKAAPDSLFVTLDGKERKLLATDLMINDANGPLCIAGVYGGLNSGVSATTQNIFLESACFEAVGIRKTSFAHGLRTDAATRFEKGTDISATVRVLKRAAALIMEYCGGEPASEIIDCYPDPLPPRTVNLKYHYLKKLSGKNYHPDAVKKILGALGFSIEKEDIDSLKIAVPYHKPDVSLPADIVEEILRIDGLDNISIPSAIHMTPAIDRLKAVTRLREKTAAYLTGWGANEILTNSITNKAYFTALDPDSLVGMKNSLSAQLNIMRPRMLQTGLEVIAHNLNRKNEQLRLFEFGKTYLKDGKGGFEETEHLCLYLSGKQHADAWKGKSPLNDFYTLKGVAEKLLLQAGIGSIEFDEADTAELQYGLLLKSKGIQLGSFGLVKDSLLKAFDIRQPVFYADLNWDKLLEAASLHQVQFHPIPKFQPVQRDIALVVPQAMPYQTVARQIEKLNLKKLQSIQLFDIFVSEKLGTDRKSLALNFSFMDREKTLTDAEVDKWMQKIMRSMEQDLNAEIRK